MTNIEIQHTRPAQTADELSGLTRLLDFLREAIVIKATGLDEETLRRQSPTASRSCCAGSSRG